MYYLIVTALVIDKHHTAESIKSQINGSLVMFKKYIKLSDAVDFMKQMPEFKSVMHDRDKKAFVQENVSEVWESRVSGNIQYHFEIAMIDD